MWFWKIMIRFFIAIDKNLFNFIATLYDLLIAISRSSVLSQGDIAQFATRVEILLGIFMLFKVSFSLITYIVNPDDFTDKQKGFGKLVQNSVISLTLLVLVPYIFQMAFSLQAKVLNDNILAKLLLGEKINPEVKKTITDFAGNEVEDKSTIIDTAGNQMAFYVMLPFFLPNYSISSLSACTKLYDGDQFDPDCQTALEGAFERNKNVQAATDYIYGITYESLGLTFRADVALESDDHDNFYIDYKYPLSTATAVITCLLLITFCIDVGVRSVKLAFLQLVYPIPVISFMDPKSGKDGIFSKWYKMCLTTFLSLFIRLLALYFGIYVISRVGRHGIVDNINGSEITNGWVKLFVIIGILMFVKQLPKLLENLGIKLDGDGKFNLNPLKRLEEGALGGKILKKPNELIAKGAKGIVHAPLGFASTMGKKTLAGIDSKKNGRGWRAGWSSQHGKLYGAYRKKKDEWMPYDAEHHKNKIQGRNDFDKSHKDWARGRDLWSRLGGNTNALDGLTEANYRKVFSHDAFAKSAMKVDRAKDNYKDSIEQYERAQANGTAAERAEARTAMDKAQKILEGAQKDHDIMRNRYFDDAQNEDALSRTKNSVDGKNVSHDATSIHRGRNYHFLTEEKDHRGTPTGNYVGNYKSTDRKDKRSDRNYERRNNRNNP